MTNPRPPALVSPDDLEDDGTRSLSRRELLEELHRQTECALSSQRALQSERDRRVAPALVSEAPREDRSGMMSRTAFEKMVAEDLAWIDTLPRSVERSHVREIVRNCVKHYYASASRTPPVKHVRPDFPIDADYGSEARTPTTPTAEEKWVILEERSGLWWGPRSGGYTDLLRAGLYSEQDAKRIAANPSRIDSAFRLSDKLREIEQLEHRDERVLAVLTLQSPSLKAETREEE